MLGDIMETNWLCLDELETAAMIANYINNVDITWEDRTYVCSWTYRCETCIGEKYRLRRHLDIPDVRVASVSEKNEIWYKWKFSPDIYAEHTSIVSLKMHAKLT